MTLYAWHGLVGPAGMPADIADRLRIEVGKAVQAPAVKTRFEGLGAEVVAGGSAEFGRLIRTELQTWQDLVKKAGIKTSQ